MFGRSRFVTYLKSFTVIAICFLGSFAIAQAQTSTWIGGAGNWSPCPQGGGDALWNTCPSYPQNNNYSAVISGGPVTEIDDNNTVINLTIGSGDVLNVNASYLYVSGTAISNNGTINVINADGLLMANLGGTTTLSGSGTVNLTNSPFEGSGSPAVTFVNQQLIQGYGSFGLGLTVDNQDTVNATGGTLTVEPSSGGITNTGLMEASSGATLYIFYGAPAPLNNTGGKIEALNSGTVMLSGPTLNDGTLTTVGSGIIQVVGGTVLNGLTNSGLLQVESGTSITLEKTVTNTGTIELPNTGSEGEINISGAVTLKGNGTVTEYTADAIIPVHTTGDSLSNSSTIEGAGKIGVKLTNHGTILANQTNPLNIAESTSGELFTNDGTLIVNNGSTLSVSGFFKNLSDGTLTGGTYEVTGTLQLPGDITTNAAKITLTGTSSQILDAVNANALAGLAANSGTGTFTLAGNRNLTTAGSFSNAGAMVISTGSAFLVSSGGFTQTGTTSKITVDGALTATGSGGAIAIDAGSVFGNHGTLNGNVNSSGTITPADSKSVTGSLTIMGTYTQTSAGALDINLQKTGFNQLSVSGNATIGGTLNVGRLKAFVPAIGASFPILTFTTLTGTFATVNGTAINSTEHFVVQYNANNVTLEVASGAE